MEIYIKNLKKRKDKKEIEEKYISLGRKLIDLGVNIILGHSPHHILPIEKYNNGIIFYSLGGLIDDYALDNDFRNDIGMITNLEFKKNSIPKLIKKKFIKIQNLKINSKKKRELLRNPI